MVVADPPVWAWGLPPLPWDGCPHHAYHVHKLVGLLIYIGYELTLAIAVATAVPGMSATPECSSSSSKLPSFQHFAALLPHRHAPLIFRH